MMEGITTSTTNTEKTQRKQRADTGPRITERDTKAMKWIAEQYFISLDHLAILLARLTEPGTYAKVPKVQGRLTTARTTAIVTRDRKSTRLNSSHRL